MGAFEPMTLNGWIAFALIFGVSQVIQAFLPFYLIRIHILTEVAPFAITLFERKP